VVFFYEAAPEYMKLHRMQHEMTGDDVFIGTAFQVISPESMLPSERWRQHEKNGSLKIVWVMRLTRHAG
jgi:NAD-dependent deacetylase